MYEINSWFFFFIFLNEKQKKERERERERSEKKPDTKLEQHNLSCIETQWLFHILYGSTNEILRDYVHECIWNLEMIGFSSYKIANFFTHGVTYAKSSPSKFLISGEITLLRV